jgi:hypothetical protein
VITNESITSHTEKKERTEDLFTHAKAREQIKRIEKNKLGDNESKYGVTHREKGTRTEDLFTHENAQTNQKNRKEQIG